MGWVEVGARVHEQRLRMGYRSLSQLARASGLSTTTLDSIEHGRKTSYDPATLSVVEHTLGWQPGSIQRILDGLDPEPIEDHDLAGLLDAWPNLSPGARRMLRLLAGEAAKAE